MRGLVVPLAARPCGPAAVLPGAVRGPVAVHWPGCRRWRAQALGACCRPASLQLGGSRGAVPASGRSISRSPPVGALQPCVLATPASLGRDSPVRRVRGRRRRRGWCPRGSARGRGPRPRSRGGRVARLDASLVNPVRRAALLRVCRGHPACWRQGIRTRRNGPGGPFSYPFPVRLAGWTAPCACTPIRAGVPAEYGVGQSAYRPDARRRDARERVHAIRGGCADLSSRLRPDPVVLPPSCRVRSAGPLQSTGLGAGDGVRRPWVPAVDLPPCSWVAVVAPFLLRGGPFHVLRRSARCSRAYWPRPRRWGETLLFVVFEEDEDGEHGVCVDQPTPAVVGRVLEANE